MRGESMKGKSKKSTYSTTFGIDPIVLQVFDWVLLKYKKPNLLRQVRTTVLWLTSRDSNPNKRCQKPLCYHYTTGQFKSALQCYSFSALSIFFWAAEPYRILLRDFYTLWQWTLNIIARHEYPPIFKGIEKFFRPIKSISTIVWIRRIIPQLRRNRIELENRQQYQ